MVAAVVGDGDDRSGGVPGVGGEGDVDGWRRWWFEWWFWRWWWLWSGDEGEGLGGACYIGSGRSVDKKCFWFRPESSPEKFSSAGER
nr:hypothetical protein [Tanacetum cinerariifolium]